MRAPIMTSQTDFHGHELRGASFSDAQLDHADFGGADLRGADFTRASLIGADFTHARLGVGEGHGAALRVVFLVAALAMAIDILVLFPVGDLGARGERGLPVIGLLFLFGPAAVAGILGAARGSPVQISVAPTSRAPHCLSATCPRPT